LHVFLGSLVLQHLSNRKVSKIKEITNTEKWKREKNKTKSKEHQSFRQVPERTEEELDIAQFLQSKEHEPDVEDHEYIHE